MRKKLLRFIRCSTGPLAGLTVSLSLFSTTSALLAHYNSKKYRTPLIPPGIRLCINVHKNILNT